jgi:hypothetical protein
LFAPWSQPVVLDPLSIFVEANLREGMWSKYILLFGGSHAAVYNDQYAEAATIHL